MKYHSARVTLSENQKNNIQKAFNSDTKNITIHLSKDHLQGDDSLNLTKIQHDKLEKARQDKTSVSFKIKMEPKDVDYEMVRVNMKKDLEPTLKLNYRDLTGDDVLLVTKPQYESMMKAFKHKRGVTLFMDAPQLEANHNAALKLKQLALHIASRDAGNTGLESEIEELKTIQPFEKI